MSRSKTSQAGRIARAPGPTSGGSRALAGGEIEKLKYFRVTKATIAGISVEISRTGYTGDLGDEIWMAWEDAPRVWDALMEGGRPFDIRPAGMLALDVARIEAGLLLIEVDFRGSKIALIESQKYSPFEMGLSRLVSLDKARFVSQAALVEEARRGHRRQIVGLEVDWPSFERL
jgi:aminomethyltransferase